ncbi:MAG: ABC transporter ATP-binding protein [Gemmatimonadaceae bacterium]
MPSLAPLRRLLPYYAPYRGMVGLGLLLVVGSAGAAAIVPWLLRAAIDALSEGLPTAAIVRLALEIIAAAILSGLLRFGMRELLNGVSRHIEYDLRNDLFGHLTTLDAAYYARTRTGDIMARLTNDLNAVRMAAGPAIMYLVNTIASGLFALTLMTRIDWRLTALALLPMTLLPILMVRLGSAIHQRFEAVQEQFGTLTTQVQENLSGVRVVRAYLQEGAELARFDELNEEYLRRNLHLVKLYGSMNPAFGLLAGIGAVIVLGFGGMLVLRGDISVGAFVAFGFYLGMLTWPLIALGWVINLFQRGSASLGRLESILTARASVTPPARPRPLPESAGGRSLEFRDVGFYYPGSEGQIPGRWVLRHVSFTVPAGATVGIVGATGSGKSTLLDLVPRLFDPQEGQILIDGVDIRDLSLDDLRHAVAMVPQESLLFSDTIGANLSYGVDLPEPVIVITPDDAAADATAGATADATGGVAGRARWAAGVAQLEATIDALPGGYETMLGERGINLSGGQRQRAALARALAREASILLLDDTLSAVDTQTEAAILRGLREVLAGRTAIIASHRVSAIRDASFVIVLDGGRVVEQGVHETLIARRGRYWSLLRRQQLESSIEAEPAAAAVAGTVEDGDRADVLATAERMSTFDG